MYDVLGGAARAAYRLHAGLRAVGQASTMCVKHRFGSDPDVRELIFAPTAAQRVKRRWRIRSIARGLTRYKGTRPAGLECFSSDRCESPWLALQLPPCDVVNLHWVAGVIDYAAFFEAVPARTPVVWTLHDMAAFTGGCHYDGSCGRFGEACGSCPQLGSKVEKDLSREIWQRKRAALAKVPAERLHIVAPSRWLAEEAKKSSLLGRFAVHVIPYGLDLEDFAPRDRRAARETLGLPQDKRVLLFVAASATNQRKGFGCLAEALKGLGPRNDVVLCSLGSGRPKIDAPLQHVHLGAVEQDRLLSMIYSAADLFVVPSMEDNLPCTALEALACGTPILGSHIGGIPDMVRPGKTGWLAPAGNAKAWREAIQGVLDHPQQLEAMARSCRRVAEEEYGLELQARRYLPLYQRLAEGPRGESLAAAARELVP